MIGFALFLILLFGSRIINFKAFNQLPNNKKTELFRLFSKFNIYSLVILIAIVAMFFFSLRSQFLDTYLIYIIYVIAVVSFIVLSTQYAYKQLKNNDFPESYIKSYLISSILRFIAIVSLFAIMGIN